MINIISKAYLSNRVSGPKKVVENIIKGFNELGYPYVINKDLASCKRLWVHDDIEALNFIKDLPEEIKVIVGPNLFIKPSNVPKNLDIKRAVFLYPSRWIKDFWTFFGFSGCQMEVWPVGIDTVEFNVSKLKKDTVMVYYKQREVAELELVKNLLNSLNIKFELIVYREYNEEYFKSVLSRSKYGIWLGRHESQGIALEEALSCGVPLIVWDVKNLGHWVPSKSEKKLFTDVERDYEPVTAAEYFDETCGYKVKDFYGLKNALKEMEISWMNFTPRDYIINNLDYKKKAKDLLEIYNKYFKLDYESGFSDKILQNKDWINNKWYNKAIVKLKDLVKNIINI